MHLRSRAITPDNPTKSHADSIRRTHFFDAYDRRNEAGWLPASDVIEQQRIPRATAYRWLQDRHEFGETAYRRGDTRILRCQKRGSQGSGRPSVIPSTQLDAMVQSSPRQRQQRLKKQATDVGIRASRRTVQRALLARRSAAMFKAAKQKEITVPQQVQRVEYTAERQYNPIEGFWDGVQFTDEAHFSLDDFPEAWILRVIGERYEPQNIVEQGNKTANVVHFAAWVNYYEKAKVLTFYNDEYDD